MRSIGVLAPPSARGASLVDSKKMAEALIPAPVSRKLDGPAATGNLFFSHSRSRRPRRARYFGFLLPESYPIWDKALGAFPGPFFGGSDPASAVPGRSHVRWARSGVRAGPELYRQQDPAGQPTQHLVVKHYHSKGYNAELLVRNLSKFVIAFLKKNRGRNKLQQLKNIACKILSSLMRPGVGSISANPYAGVAFRFSGRAYGAKKASSFKVLSGAVPFNTLGADIDYSQIMQKTRNGT